MMIDIKLMMTILYLAYILLGYFVYKMKYRFLVMMLFILVSLYISFVSYLIQPPYEFDLYRYYASIEEAGIYYDSLVEAAQDDILFLRSVIFYLFSKMPSIHYFPACISLVCYGVPLHVIYVYGKREMIPVYLVVISGFIFISLNDFVNTISVVRSSITSVLYMCLFFYESKHIRTKVICAIVYFLLPFFHSIGFFFLLIRLLMFIENEKIRICIMLLSLTFGVVIQYLFDTIINFVNGDLSAYLLGQSFAYFINSTSVDNMISFNRTLFYGIILLLVYTGVFFIRIKCNYTYRKYNNIYMASEWISCFAFGAMFVNTEILARLVYPLTLVVPLLFMQMGKNRNSVKLALLGASISIVGIVYTSRFYYLIELYLE